MSYALVQDTPATWDTYLEIAEDLGANRPEGLLVHAAGPTEEGFRMIGIWDSRDTWDRFRDHHVGLMFDGLAGSSHTRSTYRELNVLHLFLGPAFIELEKRRAGVGLTFVEAEEVIARQTRRSIG
jgi:hypothetical protein